jgi:diguanylate cyclase (GGDEF)-like protein
MSSSYIWELPRSVRTQIAETLRQHHVALTEDISSVLTDTPGIDGIDSRKLASILINLFASASESGSLDDGRGGVHDLCQAARNMQVRQVIRAIERAERLLLNELALNEQAGATSDGWVMTTRTIRSASFEIVASYAERDGGRAALRDPLTTLISQHVFRVALEQEIQRANRDKHGISILVLDVDNLSEVNKSQGFGAGDRLLERLGISARLFFRTHDWVARHRDDAIAVLLPETALDQAVTLADRYREMVQQRLVLHDHKTERVVTVTVSAAAVGAERVRSGIDAESMMAEAEAAVRRAKLEGGNCTKQVALG